MERMVYLASCKAQLGCIRSTIVGPLSNEGQALYTLAKQCRQLHYVVLFNTYPSVKLLIVLPVLEHSSSRIHLTTFIWFHSSVVMVVDECLRMNADIFCNKHKLELIWYLFWQLNHAFIFLNNVCITRILIYFK